MKHKKRKTQYYSWRWPWIAFASAIIIWLGSDIYFKRAIQIKQIEFNTNEQETKSLIKEHQSSLIYTKVFAVALATSSVFLLFKKTDES